jgi:hypothetical protein
MQFQVPQFIETEDKILWSLSIRQFIFLSMAIGCSMLLYFIFNFWIWFAFSLFIVGGTAAVVLVKVNGRSFGIIAMKAVLFYWEPQTYVWMPEQPNLPKNEDTVKAAPDGFSLEKIISGMALKSTWHRVQVGRSPASEKITREVKRAKERYETVGRITGDRRVAKRVDYR